MPTPSAADREAADGLWERAVSSNHWLASDTAEQDAKDAIAQALAAARAAGAAEAREATWREAAQYVRTCGTASHPVGFGDWCGGEVNPIKLLVGIANVLDRKAAAIRGGRTA